MQINLKAHTIGVLRNCDLWGGTYTETCGEKAGVTTHFVRCIPYADGRGTSSSKELTQEERRKICLEVQDDCKANGYGDGVIVSNNPEFGGDYVRVTKDSRAHRVICYLKS